METNAEIDRVLSEMRCHCGSYPRLRTEILLSEPAIISFWYECRCGNRTGNFSDKNDAKARWRERYALKHSPESFANVSPGAFHGSADR